MATQIEFSTILYSHARDSRFSDVFFESCEILQMQALHGWLGAFGWCDVVMPWMLEEAREAMLSAWRDEV